ncbi:hypothetical protein [Actinoallomurus iriomotensis]|uniref:Uncharacterized protein n=1 Tax=Actinoallomurus iriomotensis TaxID=478107 RepID=A0A9W6SE41_9ACTN|nr:hypothetical protein [Actinoallomurus iriomotensis]GLY91919.1 hypothetical protein Airi02_098470 [Actinoallomurus iriomotensis]
MRKENDIITRLAAAKPTGLTPSTDPHRRSRFITAALAAQALGNDHRSSRDVGLDDAPCSPDRKRTKVRRRVLAVTVAAATAVAAAIVAVSIIRPPSAQAQVTSAAQRTFGQSFRVATTVQGDGGAPVRGRGEFDPARHVGRISTEEPIGKTERRYIGDLEYTKIPDTNYMHLPPAKPAPRTRKPWRVIRISPTSSPDLQAEVDNPQWALERLQQATHVRGTGRVSGPGWTGHRYTFTNPGKTGATGQPAHGAVDIDAQGRVRQVTFTFDQYTKTDDRLVRGWLRGTIVFSDYGTAVTVTAPPTDQVDHTPLPAAPRPGATVTIQAPHNTPEPPRPAPATLRPTTP